MPLTPAIFLDRDGVINENRANYVRSIADLEFYPQALTALAAIKHIEHKIIIVTNQSGVGRGLIPLKKAEAINAHVVKTIEAAGGRVDGIYLCPHAPEDKCDCRKPRPGMLTKAAAKYGIDLAQSLMIGDALTDMEAGRNAGIPTLIMLETGRGVQQMALPRVSEVEPFLRFANLQTVVAAISKSRF